MSYDTVHINKFGLENYSESQHIEMDEIPEVNKKNLKTHAHLMNTALETPVFGKDDLNTTVSFIKTSNNSNITAFSFQSNLFPSLSASPSTSPSDNPSASEIRMSLLSDVPSSVPSKFPFKTIQIDSIDSFGSISPHPLFHSSTALKTMSGTASNFSSIIASTGKEETVSPSDPKQSPNITQDDSIKDGNNATRFPLMDLKNEYGEEITDTANVSLKFEPLDSLDSEEITVWEKQTSAFYESYYNFSTFIINEHTSNNVLILSIETNFKSQDPPFASRFRHLTRDKQMVASESLVIYYTQIVKYHTSNLSLTVNDIVYEPLQSEIAQKKYIDMLRHQNYSAFRNLATVSNIKFYDNEKFLVDENDEDKREEIGSEE